MGIRCRSTRDKDTDHASGLEANKNKKMVKNAKEKQDDEEDNQNRRIIWGRFAQGRRAGRKNDGERRRKSLAGRRRSGQKTEVGEERKRVNEGRRWKRKSVEEEGCGRGRGRGRACGRARVWERVCRSRE